MHSNQYGIWEIFIPNKMDGSPGIPHNSQVKVLKFNIYLYYLFSLKYFYYPKYLNIQ